MAPDMLSRCELKGQRCILSKEDHLIQYFHTASRKDGVCEC